MFQLAGICWDLPCRHIRLFGDCIQAAFWVSPSPARCPVWQWPESESSPSSPAKTTQQDYSHLYYPWVFNSWLVILINIAVAASISCLFLIFPLRFLWSILEKVRLHIRVSCISGGWQCLCRLCQLHTSLNKIICHLFYISFRMSCLWISHVAGPGQCSCLAEVVLI